MKKYILLLLFLPILSYAQIIGGGSFDTRVTHQKATNVVNGGNSIMDGQLASPSSNAFKELLQARYGWTEDDIATGGRGVWEEVDNINETSFTQETSIIFLQAGLNDIRRSHSAQTFNKIESAVRTSIKRALGTSSAVASGSASVTRAGGTFSGYAAETNGGIYNSGTLPCTCASTITTTNATWTWTFSGTNVFVMWGATYPSIARGDAEVRIDGNLVLTKTDMDNRWDGVSDGSFDNQRGPDINIFWGLSSGSHTIEIKVTSSGVAVPVDQIGVIQPPRTAGKVVILQIPYVLDYNKTGLDQGSDAYIDQANAIRRSIANEYRQQGYDVHYVKYQPDYYIMVPGVTIDATDSVHPLNAGHAQIYDGIKIRIKYVLPFMVASFRRKRKYKLAA